MSCDCQNSLIFKVTKNGFLCFVCLGCNKAQPTEKLKDYNIKCNCGYNDIKKWKFNSNGRYIICEECKQVLFN